MEEVEKVEEVEGNKTIQSGNKPKNATKLISLATHGGGAPTQ